MQSYTHGTKQSAPRPPSVFFDGTRLGLEGTMVVTLAIAYLWVTLVVAL